MASQIGTSDGGNSADRRGLSFQALILKLH